MDCLRVVEGGVEVTVKVVPGASRNRIAGRLGNALKIQVAAPAEKGKANKAVEALLATAVGVKAGQVTVAWGLTSQHKVVRITGTTLHQVQAALGLE